MYFLLNDDATIESILRGAFSGAADGHAIYFRYPLSGVLSLLYRILPILPWFTVVLLGCYLFTGISIGIVAYKRCMKEGKRAGGIFALMVSMLGCLLLPELIGLHYTVAAAALAGGTIFLTALGELGWIPSLMLALCFCIRREVFLLALPFWVVAMLWRVNKEAWKKMAREALILVGLSVLFICMNGFFYRSAEWQEFEQYNEARTTLYDYTWYRQYEEIPDTYEAYGVSYEEYLSMSHYATALDSGMDTAFFEKISDIALEGVWVDTPLHTLKRMLVQYRNWIFREYHEPFTYVAIAFYVILLGLLVLYRKWWKTLVVIALGIGRSAIWVYLFWKGRFPERVQMSLLVLELCLLLAFVLEELQLCKKKEKLVQILCGMAAAGALCGTLLLCMKAVEQQISQARLQDEYGMLENYMEDHPESTFFLDVKTVGNIYSESVFTTGKQQSNALLAGGWVTGSPLMKERMEQLGAKDGAEALLQLENVYYVVDAESDYSWIEQYLGQTITGMVEIGKFNLLYW